MTQYKSFGEFQADQRGDLVKPNTLFSLSSLPSALKDYPTAPRTMADALPKDEAPDEVDVESTDGAAPSSEEGGGLAYKDAWDLDPSERGKPTEETIQTLPENYKGYTLEMPDSAEDVPVVTPDGVNEWGRIAKASGFSQEVAGVFARITVDALKQDPAGPYGWNDEHSEHLLKEQVGHDEWPAIIHDVRGFTAARPHLWRALDDGLGNNPGVILALAAVAREPSLLTKEGAQKFIAKVKADKDHAYWQPNAKGRALAVAQMKLAYEVANG